MPHHSEHGASAVEFALVLPLLLLLTFGIIEFGLLLYDKAVITNASREGARAGIVFNTVGSTYTPITDAAIRTVVKNYANGLLVNLGSTAKDLTDANISISPATRTTGTSLTVTVNFTYTFLIFPDLSQLVGGTFSNSIALQGKTVMRME